MNKWFFILISIAIVGIAVSTILINNEWLALGIGLTTVFLYYFKLYNQKRITNSEVDSIYYFGFLVTLVTLLITAISIGMKPEHLISLRKVLVQFGLGLCATGFALLFRIMLLSKIQLASEQEAFEKMLTSINTTIQKFDEATLYTDAFIKKRQEDLEKIHKDFNKKLEDTYNSFTRVLEDFYNKTSNNLDKMQNNIFNVIKGSIEKQHNQLEMTTNNFCNSIERLEKNMNQVNFQNITTKIEDFTESVKKMISTISDSYSNFNENTMITLKELKEISKSISSFAGSITKKINKLEPFHEIIDSFNNFNNAWTVFSKNLQDTDSTIKKMGNTFEKFTTLVDLKDNLEKEIMNTIDNLKGISLCLSSDKPDSLIQVLNRSSILINGTVTQLGENLEKFKIFSDQAMNNLNNINDSMTNMSNSITTFFRKRQ